MIYCTKTHCPHCGYTSQGEIQEDLEGVMSVIPTDTKKLLCRECGSVIANSTIIHAIVKPLTNENGELIIGLLEERD